MDIKSLKDKILQLAIQGKLVSQDENDEPASVLLEKIKAEKEQLIKDKVIKKERTLSDISEDEKSFDLPKGWEWCRLGKATICRDGDRVPVSSKEREDRAKIYDYYGASGVIDKIDDYLFDKPLLLIGEDGANLISRSTPIAFIAYDKYWVNNHAHVIDSLEFITLKYLEIYINAIDLKSFVTGTAQPKLNQANLNQIPIMLPPLEEQERIVAKVDELFELIDELDSNKQEVLQLAIQGKLVEQCEDDEPASLLLERIKAEKEQLIKDKVIKKEKPLPDISEEEKLFKTPSSWEWCRLGNISNIVMGQSPDSSTVSDVEGGIEFHQGKASFGKVFINNSGLYCTKPSKIAIPDDILLSVRAPVGTLNITDRELCIGRGLVAIRKYIDIENKFFYYFIMALEEELVKKSTGTTFKAVASTAIKEFLIPLPPLEEQNRIVAKIDLIMDYLDKLQQEIESQEIILKDILQ